MMGKKIKICCGRGACCPTIERTKHGIYITDDYGAAILITEEQWEKMKKVEL